MISIRASLVSSFDLRAVAVTCRLKSSVTTKRYLNCFPGVVGVMGPTRSAWSRSRGFPVLMVRSLGCFFAGGLIALPGSQALHRGVSLKYFWYSGKVLSRFPYRLLW